MHVPPRPGCRPRPPRRTAFAGRAAATAVATAVAVLALAGCGGGSGSPPAPAPTDAAAEVEWVRSVMADAYLYADRLPKADLSQAAGAAQALEALRVDPPDRFSYVDRRDRYETFFDEGRTVGLGVSLRIAAGRLVLRIVQPDSPAARAGLRRGDRVVSIAGVDAAALIAAGTVSAALGPSQAGLVVRMDVERDGARREVAIGKAEYAVAPVLATRVIDRPAGKVGYVALYTFTEPARAAWGEAIATVRAAGARRLVVDLRDNGGGRLHVAAEIAGSLAPAAAVGQPFTVLRHNARRAADDLTIPVPAHAATGAFERVAWLVSDASCSASESLIAGLRPYRDDPVIGTATCGKPVGSEPRTRGDVVLSAVTFASRNRDGLTDWFDGLPPTCAVADEPFVAFGDETDPRLAEALARLETGACRSATKALPRGGPTTPAAGGLAGETGLH
jgi:C-terminal processing protease CtpA/Prc